MKQKTKKHCTTQTRRGSIKNKILKGRKKKKCSNTYRIITAHKLEEEILQEENTSKRRRNGNKGGKLQQYLQMSSAIMAKMELHTSGLTKYFINEMTTYDSANAISRQYRHT